MLHIYHNLPHINLTTGGVVNAMAISNRLSRLRKKAADDGLMPKAGVTVPAKGPRALLPARRGMGRRRVGWWLRVRSEKYFLLTDFLSFSL